MKKKLINLFMLSTIVMSQLTFGLTTLAAELENDESTEMIVEESSSTEKDNENRESTFELGNTELDIFSEADAISSLNNTTTESEQEDFIGPLNEATPRGSSITASYNPVYIPLGSDDEGIEKATREAMTVRIDGQVSSDYSFRTLNGTTGDINTDMINLSSKPMRIDIVDNSNISNAMAELQIIMSLIRIVSYLLLMRVTQKK